MLAGPLKTSAVSDWQVRESKGRVFCISAAVWEDSGEDSGGHTHPRRQAMCSWRARVQRRPRARQASGCAAVTWRIEITICSRMITCDRHHPGLSPRLTDGGTDLRWTDHVGQAVVPVHSKAHRPPSITNYNSKVKRVISATFKAGLRHVTAHTSTSIWTLLSTVNLPTASTSNQRITHQLLHRSSSQHDAHGLGGVRGRLAAALRDAIPCVGRPLPPGIGCSAQPSPGALHSAIKAAWILCPAAVS